MGARASILFLLAALCCGACWMFGYHEGQQTGAFHLVHEMNGAYVRGTYNRDVKSDIDVGRDQVCNEIRNYKFAMAKDLDENTQICGWPDMDDEKKSN